MNHPTQQQWMEYLYGEFSTPERKQLESHLKACESCREKHGELQGTSRSLDAWRVPAPVKRPFANRFQPGLKWAVAAVLLVTTAFATGRMARPEIDVAELQSQISGPLEEKMQREIQLASERALASAREKLQTDLAFKLQAVADQAVAEADATARQHLERLAITFAALRDEDKNALNATLQAFEKQRRSDFRNFREDLERVALYSEQSHRTAQRQLVQLASLTQPQEN